jgi:hypothetical protein
MVGNPAGADSSPQVDARREPDDRRTPPEREGPVSIDRHRKDDGRALILYAHADGERS